MGPSGSGKTTLFNMIGALDTPTKGKVVVNGHDMGSLSQQQVAYLRCHNVGYIFQAFNLIPVMTALENVSFGYNSKRVLEGVDLTIAAGETVAVTGANGSGKTSILYLLLGLYAPQTGRLLADGTPYSSISISSLRRHIGVVTQDPVLFAGTIAENIAYTDMDADAEAIEAAARSALAHDFIADLPNGYDTKVGESGVFLSGGQRQRITLARALLKRPRLLILDEPSNHLDPETTAYLINHLAALPERPGILVITHDPHLAEQADRIYHLQDGRLISTANVLATTS